MKSAILSEVFAEFCESRVHLDALLSKVDPSRKHKVARLMGAFLRRPWAISRHFGVELASDAAEFFEQGFLRLKKHAGIHETLRHLWENGERIPNEGTRDDFPLQMVSRWESDWGGQDADALCRLLSQDPLTTIRLHRKCFDSDGGLVPGFREWLDSGELPKSRSGHFMGSARIFRGYAAVQQNRFFKEGFFEIQDEGSQLMSAFALFPHRISPMLRDRPVTQKTEVEAFPATVRSVPLDFVDACAGAGGKTLAVSDLMAGKGRIFAYDLYESKIRGLKTRVARSGERNVKALLLDRDSTEGVSGFQGSADVVLIDAPCSGLGVSRRNPDVKWSRKPLEKIRRTVERTVHELQDEVLRTYSTLVRPGGRLVYGVCTFSKDETCDRVSSFLQGQEGFKLEAQGYAGPRDTDGFYMASLVREA
ncbi:MAG: RsmB/NOP family class I SAM-dependent RNA methyltransferase [Proteobacteria bacterium]|nr:RsmB/NOP family class I SAM-dependent RNA methyltransferase [Pseudomonadota bacterium]